MLNQGGAATWSDTLVVDGAAIGTGLTQTFIKNFGGTGGLTVGDGILVVEVLDPTRSVPARLHSATRFRRALPSLFQAGLNGSNPADWFPRNVFVVTPPTPTPTPTPTPHIRPAAPMIVGPRVRL